MRSSLSGRSGPPLDFFIESSSSRIAHFASLVMILDSLLFEGCTSMIKGGENSSFYRAIIARSLSSYAIPIK